MCLDHLTVQEKSVYFHVRGTGHKTLVLVHGAGGNGLHWMDVTPPAGWRLVAVDLPGHGKSEGEAKSSIPEYAQWITELIHGFGGCDILAGHSMGGAITMSVALSHPELLQGIILVGTGAKLSVSQAIFDRCHGGVTARVEDLLAKLAYGKAPSFETIKEWYRTFGAVSCQSYLRDFTACHHFDIRHRLPEISLPALVVCGLDDRLTPYKYSQYLAAHLPNALLEGIPDAGHMVMLEQSQQFNRVIADYCSRF
jgi:pimeloyl-ACP methyl ester carboxylesterase